MYGLKRYQQVKRSLFQCHCRRKNFWSENRHSQRSYIVGTTRVSVKHCHFSWFARWWWHGGVIRLDDWRRGRVSECHGSWGYIRENKWRNVDKLGNSNGGKSLFKCFLRVNYLTFCYSVWKSEQLFLLAAADASNFTRGDKSQHNELVGNLLHPPSHQVKTWHKTLPAKASMLAQKCQTANEPISIQFNWWTDFSEHSTAKCHDLSAWLFESTIYLILSFDQSDEDW